MTFCNGQLKTSEKWKYFDTFDNFISPISFIITVAGTDLYKEMCCHSKSKKN